MDFVSQEAEILAGGVANYLANDGLPQCPISVVPDPIIGHVIPQSISGKEDFQLSLRVRRPFGKCQIVVKQGDTVLKTLKLPKAIPAEMIQFMVPAEKIQENQNIEVLVNE